MKEAPLSTILDAKVKKAAQAFCKANGLKLRYLIEQALMEYMEDEEDLKLCRERQGEESLPLEEVLKKLRAQG